MMMGWDRLWLGCGNNCAVSWVSILDIGGFGVIGFRRMH